MLDRRQVQSGVKPAKQGLGRRKHFGRMRDAYTPGDVMVVEPSARSLGVGVLHGLTIRLVRPRFNRHLCAASQLLYGSRVNDAVRGV